MKYICCIWLTILWLICHVQHEVFGLHVQQAPEIIQRITRQATRYGSIAAANSQNYYPAAINFNGHKDGTDLTKSLTSSQLNSLAGSSGQRPIGVGAFSFGGMASGRPTNGNSFVVNNSLKGSGLRGSPSTANHAIVGSGSIAGRPQQYQQALLQAAQYQLQQQQQQPLRRQLAQHQQLYRQRPAIPYQQYK